MSKQILELKLETMASGGEALSNHEGKKIFVPEGVPGDLVKVELVEEKKDFARGRILEMLEPSLHRQKAECPYFFTCGGCQWQHIQYKGQLAFKQDLLRVALQRIGKIPNPNLLEALGAFQPFHYRNKIRLQVSKEAKVGFYKSHSKQLVEIDSCLIAEEALNNKIPQAKALARQLLAQNPTKLHEIEIFQEGGKVLLQANPGPERSFGQVNSDQNLRLKEKVLGYLNLSGKENVLELFAGEGNFTFSIAEKCRFVMAVESNTQAVLGAEKKMSQSHHKNIEFIESTVSRFLQNPLPLLKGKGGRFNRILLDPPRRGMMLDLGKLALLKVPEMIYVSCDPATLARDVKDLQDLGYQHDFSQVIDMFPQTYHVESMTRLFLAS